MNYFIKYAIFGIVSAYYCIHVFVHNSLSLCDVPLCGMGTVLTLEVNK